MTGAGGFVGRYLVDALRPLIPDGRIWCATRHVQRTGNERTLWVQFDLEDAASMQAALDAAEPDLIVHLAAQSSVNQSTAARPATWAINLGGSLALARALADRNSACTLLFASSAEVYGLTFNNEVPDERSALRPMSAYARSKAAAEAMFDDVLPNAARLIVARPSNHSGRGQDEAFVIPAFAAQIARIEQGAGSAIRVGNLEAKRDFLHVQDVINAYVGLLMRAETLPFRSTFNIASGITVPIATVLDRLRVLSGCTAPIEQEASRLRSSDVKRAAVNAQAIRDVIGWAPRHTLDALLADVLADQRLKAMAELQRRQ